MLQFETLMGVVFKPHLLNLEGLDPGQAGRQDRLIILGRTTSRVRAVSRPKWTKFWVFEGQKHLTPHRQRRTRRFLHHPHPSACRARRGIRNGTVCVRAGMSKILKNTDFATILEMGLREAYTRSILPL